MKLYFSLKSIDPSKMFNLDPNNLVYCIKKTNQFYNCVVVHNGHGGTLNRRGGWRKIKIKKIG